MMYAHLIRNLSIPLKEEHSKEERDKHQEAEKPDVVLPPLSLLAIPATARSVRHLVDVSCCPLSTLDR